ncbi:hypothetical protein BDQ17DRAFT_1543201 [Cyathus striatus]|nr:hypothetical protein BDQ17DRAFT_1543201 [Cyathus striatus]
MHTLLGYFGLRNWSPPYLLYMIMLVLWTKRIHLGVVAIHIVPWGIALLLYLCQVTLCYRLCALYNNNKRFIGLIGLLFLLEILVTAGTVIHDQDSYIAVLKELHGSYLCMMMNPVHELHAKSFWITVIAFETILLFLTLSKFMSDLKHAPTMRRFSLTRLIVRDSVIYYSIAFATYFSVGIVWTIKPELNPMMTACFMPALSTTIACRLIIHLSEAHKRDVNNRCNVWSSDVRVTSRRERPTVDIVF